MSVPRIKKAAVTSKKKVKLTWNRDSKATGYYIYRSNKKKGGYKKVKTITKNKSVTWTDSGVKKGKTYYYKIRSYVKTSSGKGTSGYSGAKAAKVAKK